MNHGTDRSSEMQAQVEQAISQKKPIGIVGGQSKISSSQLEGLSLVDTTGHEGIVEYHPTELTLTARTGTRLSDISELLSEQGQHLPFESPEHGGRATLGGTIATGAAGPRRPWSGSVSDHVLGCRIISGGGKLLRFGGQVMKNVAGYDVSRLMTGSYGCLGLMTEISLKVMPKPADSITLQLDMSRSHGLDAFAQWRKQGIPISALMHDGSQLFVRIEGSEDTVSTTRRQIGGQVASAETWNKLREKQLDFFQRDQTLWRLSLPMGTLLSSLPGPALMDWAGAQWWIKTDASVEKMQGLAASLGGHAVGYPINKEPTIRQAPHASIMQLNKRLKAQLDPMQLFNPGMLYAGL
ncbi:MAG TPA: glycolate oxidase subunit GlcE [Pusillimonas sp.]|jgi:glycolate oxidase FAD binding subunit|nr:glycolate oxidase subunit GlcE [Pusillimonas sp.]MBC41369.1 glycolate oxidase subunit GlcE [Pusillimonas sp.]HBT32099.1 glycolate oxidase subunit GlcE [Pusillimonas sp.]HCP77568.1 glycolate oxidase subunit GlcE [Pusillimonas sp.]|tara:strand:+ start:127967 stop:129025 length:1059 start_codon:yes stop_codon:yes gene_type:complete